MRQNQKTDYVLAKTYVNLLRLIGCLILTGIVMLLLSEFKRASVDKNENVPFCGVVSSLSKKDSLSRKRITIGKEHFKLNCAQCHNKNMRDELTGPALSNTFINWKNDTLGYVTYVTNSDNYLKFTKNKRILELSNVYGMLNIHANNLTYTEVVAIIAYIENR